MSIGQRFRLAFIVILHEHFKPSVMHFFGNQSTKYLVAVVDSFIGNRSQLCKIRKPKLSVMYFCLVFTR